MDFETSRDCELLLSPDPEAALEAIRAFRGRVREAARSYVHTGEIGPVPMQGVSGEAYDRAIRHIAECGGRADLRDALDIHKFGPAPEAMALLFEYSALMWRNDEDEDRMNALNESWERRARTFLKQLVGPERPTVTN